MKPEVTMIIPNWNGAPRLRALFQTIAGHQPVSEVIVVDNGSTDDSCAVAEAAGARTIALPRNEGFAAAVNRGLEAAATPWVAVINNDVELTPGWLERLLAAAQAQDAWFATGKLLDARSRDCIDGTFDAICRGGTAWRCGHGQPDGPLYNQPARIDFAPFTALLLRKELAARVGPLDERFESYLEDVDFGLRCALAGLTGIYVPDAVAYHQGSATLGRWHPETVRRISRNQVFLVAKYFRRRWTWPVVVAQTLWGLIALRHGAGAAWLKGKREGLHLLRTIPRATGPDPTAILARSEQQIRSDDLYWKLYFALT